MSSQFRQPYPDLRTSYRMPAVLLPFHEQPTEPGRAVPRFAPVLYGHWAEEALRAMRPGEAPTDLVIRLLLFYQHSVQGDDTALVAAKARHESEVG